MSEANTSESTPFISDENKIMGKDVSGLLIQVDNKLQERKAAFSKEDIEGRKAQAARSLKDQLLPPDVSPQYAAAWWRNFGEMMNRVVDIETDEQLMPTVDSSMHSSVAKSFRQGVIHQYIEDRVQEALGENRLTKDQLWNCFTNVSPEQIDTISAVVAESGLTIFDETPSERWKKISADNSKIT